MDEKKTAFTKKKKIALTAFFLKVNEIYSPFILKQMCFLWGFATHTAELEAEAEAEAEAIKLLCEPSSTYTL